MGQQYAVKGYSMGPFHRLRSDGWTVCGRNPKAWRVVAALYVPTGARFCCQCAARGASDA